MDYPHSTEYCSLCDRKFKHRKNLYRHNREIHGHGRFHHQCPVTTCGRIFGRKYALNQHLKTDHCSPYEEPVFVTVTNDLYSDISDENDNDFEEFFDNPYSPVSKISLTSLEETMDRLQSGNENNMEEEEYTMNAENYADEEYILNLGEDEDTVHCEDEEEDVMIQEDNGVPLDSSSDVPHTSKIDTREIMCITLTLKKFQHTYLDGHQSIERETEISYSEGLVPEEIDFSAVAENILNEVPEHMDNLRNRFVSAENIC